MKILFYEVQNLVQTFTSSLVRKQYLPKKNFAQKLENRKNLSKSVYGPLSHWCSESKTLEVRLQKNKSFLCVSSLTQLVSICSLYINNLFLY